MSRTMHICSTLRLALFSGFVLVLFITSVPSPFFRKNGYTYHNIGRTRPLYSSASMTMSDVVSSSSTSSKGSKKTRSSQLQYEQNQQQQANSYRRPSHDMLDAAAPANHAYGEYENNNMNQEEDEDEDSTLMLAKHYHQIERNDPERAYVSTVTSHRYEQPQGPSRHKAAASVKAADLDNSEHDNTNNKPDVNDSTTISNTLIHQQPHQRQASFSCKPRLPSQAQTRTPLLVFSTGGNMAGAHLFFDTLLHQASLPPRLSSANNNHPFYRKHAQHAQLMNFQHLFAAGLPGEGTGSSGDAMAPNAGNAIGSYMWDTAIAMAESCLDTDLNNLEGTMQKQWLSTRVGIADSVVVSRRTASGNGGGSGFLHLRGAWRHKKTQQEQVDINQQQDHNLVSSLSSSPSSSTQLETLRFLRKQGEKRPNIAKMVSLFESRRYNMVNTLQFLNQLPCLGNPQTTKPTLAIHLSNEVLQSSKVEPDALIGLLYEQFTEDTDEDEVEETPQQEQPIQFVILWRRCLIETFVHLELEAQRKARNGGRRLSEVSTFSDSIVKGLEATKEFIDDALAPLNHDDALAPVTHTKLESKSKDDESANQGTQQQTQQHQQQQQQQELQQPKQQQQQQAQQEHQSLWPTKRAESPSELIEVDFDRLRKFIKETKKFYSSLRNQFEALGIEYHVFEYERDFSTPRGMFRSVQRVQGLLDLDNNTSDANKHAQEIVEAWSKKQEHSHRTKPLNRLVNNWEDVVEWGYGSTSAKDWEDFFSGHEN